MQSLALINKQERKAKVIEESGLLTEMISGFLLSS